MPFTFNVTRNAAHKSIPNISISRIWFCIYFFSNWLLKVVVSGGENIPAYLRLNVAALSLVILRVWKAGKRKGRCCGESIAGQKGSKVQILSVWDDSVTTLIKRGKGLNMIRNVY